MVRILLGLIKAYISYQGKKGYRHSDIKGISGKSMGIAISIIKNKPNSPRRIS